MSRPASGKDWKVTYTIRLEPEFSKEIDFIVEDLFSSKAGILGECIRLGYEQLKKEKSAISDSSKKYHHAHGNSHEKKRHAS